MGNRLIGYGSYLPERVLDNHYFEGIMDTTDEWIVTRTGIRERHIARDDETVSDMGTIAARRALDNAGLMPDDIDLIICATTSAENAFPSIATMIQRDLLMTNNAPAFDVRAACTGYVYALHVARAFFAAGMYNRIMVVGAEKMSRFIDWTDRSTAVLLGDGAGAMIFEHSTSNYTGIVDTVIYSNGAGYGMLHEKPGPYLDMNGPETYKNAVKLMPEVARYIMDHAGISADNIDWVIPHQANRRIIESSAEKLGVPLDKVIITVDKHANTSGASGVLAISDGLDRHMIKRGQLLMYPAFGSGLTWGAALIRI